MGVKDDGPLWVSVRRVEAFAFKLVHGEVSTVDGRVFSRDVQDAEVVGFPGSIVPNGFEAGLEDSALLRLKAVRGGGCA